MTSLDEHDDDLESLASDPSELGAGGEEDGISLEGRLQRLEEIVVALESDEVELDLALKLFEEGVNHLRRAEKTLSETELRVRELLGDGSEALTRPFEGIGE